MLSSTVPPARQPVLAYDSLRGKIVMFSGQRVPSPLRDTWEWNGIDWTQRFTATAPPFRAYHAMVYDERYHRCVVFGGFAQPFSFRDDTWSYSFGCDVVGDGITGGGALAITCTSPPQIGGSLCVEFANPMLVGVLAVGLSPPIDPPLPLPTPTFCVQSNLWAFPDVTIPVASDPASVCIPVPNDPVLVGGLFTMQGIVVDLATCLTVTDGLGVIVQP